MKNQNVMSLIVIVFFFHSSITNTTLYIFACKPLEEGSYLIKDMSVECYVGDHVVMLGLGVLSTAIWVVGYPVLIAILLRRHSRANTLMQEDTYMKYGFLLNGYKKETYYWELVIIARKVFIMISIVVL